MTNHQITKEKFIELSKKEPLRIVLPKSIKRDDNYGVGTLSFSFSNTIKPIFEKETGLDLRESNFQGVWRMVVTEKEYEQIEQWIAKQGSTVFIRSLLPLCMALDVGFDFDQKTKTHIGELEYQIKSRLPGLIGGLTGQVLKNIDELVSLLCTKIQNTAFYKEAAYIVAVPPSPDKKLDLPSLLVEKIAKNLNLQDIGVFFSYNGVKSTLKDKKLTEKWQILEQSDLVFGQQRGKINKDKGIILLDDKYQSGATMHYTARALQQAGLKEIYGLAVVKTMTNDDNQ